MIKVYFNQNQSGGQLDTDLPVSADLDAFVFIPRVRQMMALLERKVSPKTQHSKGKVKLWLTMVAVMIIPKTWWKPKHAWRWSKQIIAFAPSYTVDVKPLGYWWWVICTVFRGLPWHKASHTTLLQILWSFCKTSNETIEVSSKNSQLVTCLPFWSLVLYHLFREKL